MLLKQVLQTIDSSQDLSTASPKSVSQAETAQTPAPSHTRNARPLHAETKPATWPFARASPLLRFPGLRPEPVAPSGQSGRRARLNPAPGRDCARLSPAGDEPRVGG
jgi:hypothetical protein